MIVAALHGLRGGTGASAITAALAEALVLAGRRVLCIDLDPRNLLRLHFNHPWEDDQGWAVDAERDWHQKAFALGEHLHVLPYGRASGAAERFEHDWRTAPQAWPQRLARLDARHYDWVLLDVPTGWPEHQRQARRMAALWLTVAHADAACHTLLADRPVGVNEFLLVNRFASRSALQSDLLGLWQRDYRDWLAPCVIHQDEGMFEALAHKRSVVGYRPDSLASQDLRRLTAWLLTREGTP